MERSFNQWVWKRAKRCCEYCRMPQEFDDLPFQIDHILARQHGGSTTSANTGLACMACNKFKGPNIASLDPATRKLVPLFHPRRHKWTRHFRWQGPVLIGRTPIGRATIWVLCINLPERVALRALLIDEGVFPPD
jgi:hypothetical protein